MAVFEHEDDTHALHFKDAEVDNLELYEYEYADECEQGVIDETAPDDVVKRLCVPHSTYEPDLDPATLLELGLLADELEISRLKAMGVLIPAENYDAAGQVPKKLSTRMVRAWRDKHVNGEHVWLRRDVKIEECAPYPCLLRTEHAEQTEKPACLLLLHVDDVLCLSRRTYLESTLLAALKARYKISNEIMAHGGDELTFLKRRHVVLSEDELALQFKAIPKISNVSLSYCR
eukprot:s2275_g10.t1